VNCWVQRTRQGSGEGELRVWARERRWPAGSERASAWLQPSRRLTHGCGAACIRASQQRYELWLLALRLGKQHWLPVSLPVVVPSCFAS